MIEFFFKGGLLFMGILTAILLLCVFISVIVLILIITGKINNSAETLKKINYIRSAGIFALIFGILGQLIGLFSAFKAIKLESIEVTPSVIAEGFQVSMTTTIYGLIIFIFSKIIWFVLKKYLKSIEIRRY